MPNTIFLYLGALVAICKVFKCNFFLSRTPIFQNFIDTAYNITMQINIDLLCSQKTSNYLIQALSYMKLLFFLFDFRNGKFQMQFLKCYMLSSPIKFKYITILIIVGAMRDLVSTFWPSGLGQRENTRSCHLVLWFRNHEYSTLTQND